MRGHHVVRQAGFQPGAQGVKQRRPGFLAGNRRCIGWHHIAQQLLAARRIQRQYHGFADCVLLLQARLDLAKFDTEAANLHLMVDTPGIFDDSVGVIARQVAGAIQAATLPAERVGDEAFGGKPGARQVTTRQPRTRHVQLPHHPYRQRRSGLAQQVSGTVGKRPADIGLATLGAQGEGRVGCVLRRPVQVVHLEHVASAVQRVDQPLLESLPRQVDDAYTGRQLAGFMQHLDGRRHRVDQAYLVFGRQVRQLQGIGRQYRIATRAQGHEQLPDRQVETDRCGRQHAAQVLLAVHRLRPADHCHGIAMLDLDALGIAGGT